MNRRHGCANGARIELLGEWDATSCEESASDFVSELDPTWAGVDNTATEVIGVLETLSAPRFAQSLDDAVREGRLRWALRIGELTDDGAHIPLELFVIDAGEALTFDADGMPATGQRLRAHRVAEASALVRRDVAWGRAETRALSVDGDVLVLPFHDLRLGAFGVAAQPTTDTLYGNLGGSFPTEAFVDVALRDIPGPTEAIVRPVVEGIADLEPSAADPLVCERVSVGFGVEAVPVELIVD